MMRKPLARWLTSASTLTQRQFVKVVLVGVEINKREMQRVFLFIYKFICRRHIKHICRVRTREIHRKSVRNLVGLGKFPIRLLNGLSSQRQLRSSRFCCCCWQHHCMHGVNRRIKNADCVFSDAPEISYELPSVICVCARRDTWTIRSACCQHVSWTNYSYVWLSWMSSVQFVPHITTQLNDLHKLILLRHVELARADR
jgi:hypothetical protein